MVIVRGVQRGRAIFVCGNVLGLPRRYGGRAKVRWVGRGCRIPRAIIGLDRKIVRKSGILMLGQHIVRPAVVAGLERRGEIGGIGVWSAAGAVWSEGWMAR